MSVLSHQARDSLTSEGEYYENKGEFITIPRSCFTSSSYASAELVDVPTTLKSQTALEWLGFAETSAKSMVALWEKIQGEKKDASFYDDIIYATINLGHDAVNITDDWPEAIRSMGMTKAFRKRIMSQRYNRVRLSETAKFWVVDTVEAKYTFLMGLFNKVLGRHVKQTEFVSLQSRMAKVKVEQEGKKTGKELKIGESSKASHSLIASTTDQFSAQEAEMVMYKGGKMKRLLNAINQKLTPSTIDLESLASTPPTDFERVGFSLYFTKQKSLAEEFVGYAAERLDNGKWVEVGLLTLTIPTSMLANMVEIDGSAWKEYVWRQRLNDHRNFPNHLGQYEAADILLGGMLQISTKKVEEIEESGGNYTHLEPCKLFDGTIGSQYCFKSRDLVKKANSVCRAWIESRGMCPWQSQGNRSKLTPR